jgi:hypothetical protein
MELIYNRKTTTTVEETINISDGTHYCWYKDEFGERYYKLDIKGDYYQQLQIDVRTESKDYPDISIRYRKDSYELPYCVQCVFGKEKDTKFITKEEFDIVYINALKSVYSENQDQLWNELSDNLKTFCDNQGYISKPLQTVMPMILQELQTHYDVIKRQ